MKHSILSPSSSHIWGKPDGCTGYVTMSQIYKQNQSYAANEGSAAHELCEMMFKHDYSKGDFELKDSMISDQGIVFNDEMLDSAKLYFDDVCSILLLNKASIEQVNTEQRVDCKSINELSFGTVDAYLHNKADNVLYLWDFKYGRIFVDVFENWQLINYASGLKDKLELNKDTCVNFRIVQPRSFHSKGPVANWLITISDLNPYFKQLHDAAIESLGVSSKLRSGSHCKYCPARHACTNAINSGISLYESSSKVEHTELSERAIGIQLSVVKRALEQLKCIESGLEQQAKSLISKGSNIPGWVMQNSKGKKDWKIGVEQVIEFGKENGFDLYKEKDVITPTQAIKLGLDKDDVNKNTERKNTGLKLIKDDPKAALKIFGRIEHD